MLRDSPVWSENACDSSKVRWMGPHGIQVCSKPAHKSRWAGHSMDPNFKGFNEFQNKAVGDFGVLFVFLEVSQHYEAEIWVCSGSNLQLCMKAAILKHWSILAHLCSSWDRTGVLLWIFFFFCKPPFICLTLLCNRVDWGVTTTLCFGEKSFYCCIFSPLSVPEF